MSVIKPWKIERREHLGNFKIFDVYRQVNHSPRHKKSGDFYVLEAPNWINVIAITPKNEVVLVRQYRQGSDSITLETPGGAVDKSDNDPAEAAIRELREETGYTSQSVQLIGKVLPNPAIQNNWCYFYLAEDAHKTEQPELDSFEDIEVVTVPLEDISEMIAKGEIVHSLAVTPFYYLSLHNQRKSRG